jgi:hypothetical protein
MIEVMDRHMWRVIVVEMRDNQPFQDVFHFWNEDEALYFFNKTNTEGFDDPNAYKYALAPKQIK